MPNNHTPKKRTIRTNFTEEQLMQILGQTLVGIKSPGYTGPAEFTVGLQAAFNKETKEIRLDRIRVEAVIDDTTN